MKAQQVQNVSRSQVIDSMRSLCSIKTSVDMKMVEELRAGNFGLSDGNLKKYAFCVFRLLTLMDETGSINKDKALPLLPETTNKDRFVQALETCNNIQGNEPAEKAWGLLKCYNEQYPNDITFAL